MDKSRWPLKRPDASETNGVSRDQLHDEGPADELSDDPSVIWQLQSTGNTQPDHSTSVAKAPHTSEHYSRPHHTCLRSSSVSSSLYELIGTESESSFDSDQEWESISRDDCSQLDGAKNETLGAQISSGTGKRKGKQARKAKRGDRSIEAGSRESAGTEAVTSGIGRHNLKMDSGDDYNGDDWQQAGANAEAVDVAGPGLHGRLECTVTKPQKENEGTQNQFISYLVTSEVGDAEAL